MNLKSKAFGIKSFGALQDNPFFDATHTLSRGTGKPSKKAISDTNPEEVSHAQTPIGATKAQITTPR